MSQQDIILKEILNMKGENAEQHKEILAEISSIKLDYVEHKSDKTIHFGREVPCAPFKTHIEEHKRVAAEAKDSQKIKVHARTTYVAALIGSVSAFLLMNIHGIFSAIANVFKVKP